MKRITIKTRIGWVTAFEKNNKIFKIKFGKYKKQANSKVLKIFKKNLLKYFQKKTSARHPVPSRGGPRGSARQCGSLSH